MNVFPGKNEAIITFSIISTFIGLVVGLLVGLLETNSNDFIKSLILGLPTLIGAFLGAWFAFSFQNKHQENRLIQERFEAINRAIFLLGRFVNELEIIRQQIINPVREKQDNWLWMEAAMISEHKDYYFDIKALSFILETNTPELLDKLLIEEARFHQAINSMNIRSNIHIEKVQPILEDAGVNLEDEYHLDELKKILGPKISATLLKATPEIIKAFDQSVSTSNELSDIVFKMAKKWFPGKNPISIKYVDSH